MIRTILLALCTAIAICSPTIYAQESRTATWAGTIDANGISLRIELEIIDKDGELAGEARSLDQGNAKLKMADIVISDQAFSFSIPQVGGEFSGTFSADGASVNGTFSQGQGEAPLTLTKKDVDAAAQSEPAASLDERLEELGKVIEWYVEKDRVVGAELQVIQAGETIFHESFGLVDRKDERPWENNTTCNIRSMTKPITSAAAQILVDRGLLELDVPVAKYLESFDNEKSGAITVRQVLTHRSGLPLTNLIAPYQYPSLAEQVASAGETGPKFEPDSKFWYSDTGTDVVGRLVEKVSGEPLHEFVQRELFDPLGMSGTFYGIDAEDPRFSRAASLYVKGSKGWFRFWIPKKPLYPFAWGSQTVYSTTTDYAKFLQMFINGGRVGDRQLLSSDAVERMLEPVSEMKMLGSDANYPTGFRDLETFYGQMMVTHRVNGNRDEKPVIIGHSGSDGTNSWAWPEKDLIILYFTQSRGGMTALKIEKPIDRLLIHPGEVPVAEDVPEHLQPLVGTYIANYGGFDNEEFTVFVKKGKLILDVPSQMEFELMEPDEDGKWAFAIAPKQIQAAFDRNEKGDVTGIKLYRTGEVYEVPRKGTARAEELSKEKASATTEQQEKASQEKLQEAWVGKLDLGGIDPVMQFRIVKNESGATVAYFDSITEGKTDFEATWSIEDGTLKFDVVKIGLKYRGSLNEAQDTAEGTWSQGGRDMPLVLKKQSTEYDK